ncbi:Cbp6 [Kluyveromyces lactis]|uniref:KLLA0B08954p n=1 Tax=Kluyveromyces lactis (strain ATCC 8585 / CBS 2359 / DSM 70799 / NBRC 1267 / NRRL Y-1140 / WM37) TaxID=284590 RepID=Q6CVW2_KLULA|nr:uncharacterized protein KLLA0_B08954g [Kluyveromyces lactis]QEU61859.1 Cbp6 [Kluyveromyces lactis]CAH02320.1 KLLA0B08954p [Kluyveromyces lactis]|eukprot:XP_451927.1 uncharacterized protein KLLA0_B08954g [Kluyveromyces lactis]
MSQATKESAKQLVKLLEKFPKERVKHLISFKESQLDRFRPVAGIETGSASEQSKPSLAEIKDIINRTSGPLGLKKDLLKKVQEALPEEHFNDTQIQEQIRSLNAIMSDKYKNYYAVGDKLYKPAGNPIYYKRLHDEIEGKGKETFFTAMRTVVFGK